MNKTTYNKHEDDKLDDMNYLWELCEKFIIDHSIVCPEACGEDRIYENTPDFINDICKIVGYYKYEDEDADQENSV